MKEIDLINILPLVQVAVVFNIGLFYVRKKNSLSELVIAFLRHLESVYDSSVKFACTYIDKHAASSKTRDCVKNAKMMRHIDSLISIFSNRPNSTSPIMSSPRWGMYCTLGLYSGIYGFIALLVIGLKGSAFIMTAYGYLLFCGEIIIAAECWVIFSTVRRRNDNELIKSLHTNTILLLLLISIAGMMAYFDLGHDYFEDVRRPILWSLILIYAPCVAFIADLGIIFFKTFHKILLINLLVILDSIEDIISTAKRYLPAYIFSNNKPTTEAEAEAETEAETEAEAEAE